MYAKGTFFVGRRTYVLERFGEARWNALIEALAPQHPVFAKPILATTLVPIEAYIAFQDRVVRDLFDGDTRALWTVGEKSAEWSLTEGPYKHLRNNPKSIEQFVEKLPLIWTAFFTEGELRSRMVDKGTVEIELVDLPVGHQSFELAVMGYGRRALELVWGGRVDEQKLVGIQTGQSHVKYRFALR